MSRAPDAPDPCSPWSAAGCRRRIEIRHGTFIEGMSFLLGARPTLVGGASKFRCFDAADRSEAPLTLRASGRWVTSQALTARALPRASGGLETLMERER